MEGDTIFGGPKDLGPGIRDPGTRDPWTRLALYTYVHSTWVSNHSSRMHYMEWTVKFYVQ